MANTCIFGIIISKLGYRQECNLIILLEIDKSLKISFYNTVLPLCLAICLRVKRGKEFPLNAEKVAER